MKIFDQHVFVFACIACMAPFAPIRSNASPASAVSNLLHAVSNDRAWAATDDLKIGDGRLSAFIRAETKFGSARNSPNDFSLLFDDSPDDPSLLFLLLRKHRALFFPVTTNHVGKTYHPKPHFAVEENRPRFGLVVVCWEMHSDMPVDGADEGQIVKTACFEYSSRSDGTTVLLLWNSSVDGKRLPFLLGFRRNPKTGYPELPKEIKRELLAEAEKIKKERTNGEK